MEKYVQISGLTKEVFLEQFSEISEEIVARVHWAWEKGCSKFSSFGKEDLVFISCRTLEKDEGHPIGFAGQVFWFSRRKLLGYPYTPRFNRNEYYRLRVRRCKSGYDHFVLEDVLETNVNVSAASSDDMAYFWHRDPNPETPETPEQAAMYSDRIQNPSGLFAGIDLSQLFDNGRKCRSRYEFPKITEEWIERAEKAIGYKISPAYRELLTYQNGGEVRDDNDERWLTAIYGIGPKPNCDNSLESMFDNWKCDWEYPDIGIPFGETCSGGHDMYYMDYRSVDSNGEPRIVHIDNEGGNEITFVADNLVEFIRIVLENREKTLNGEKLE